MNKIAATFVIAISFIFVFSSCKKDYTCSCTYNNQVAYTVNIGEYTKSDAQSLCDTNTHVIPGETLTCTVH
jgi:hypothetical protein